MHNPDDKYPTRPGFEPSTSEFQATIESNEPSGRPTAKDTRLSNAMAWALVQWLNLPEIAGSNPPLANKFHSSHHPQEALLARFSLYLHKDA